MGHYNPATNLTTVAQGPGKLVFLPTTRLIKKLFLGFGSYVLFVDSCISDLGLKKNIVFLASPRKAMQNHSEITSESQFGTRKV